MRITRWIFIIGGILTFLYPIGKNTYSNRVQKKYLLQFESEMVSLKGRERGEQEGGIIPYQELGPFFSSYRKNKGKYQENLTLEMEDVEEKSLEESRSLDIRDREIRPMKEEGSFETAIGIIYIDKIQLKLPVLNGSTGKHLDKGAGHLPGTDLPGEYGNSAIAAHRSHTYGRFFNRLNELETGDIIRLQSLSDEFYYYVYDKKIVKPQDVSVLKRNSQEKRVTLITCDPIYKGTHRLIIHARMIP